MFLLKSYKCAALVSKSSTCRSNTIGQTHLLHRPLLICYGKTVWIVMEKRNCYGKAEFLQKSGKKVGRYFSFLDWRHPECFHIRNVFTSVFTSLSSTFISSSPYIFPKSKEEFENRQRYWKFFWGSSYAVTMQSFIRNTACKPTCLLSRKRLNLNLLLWSLSTTNYESVISFQETRKTVVTLLCVILICLPMTMKSLIKF